MATRPKSKHGSHYTTMASFFFSVFRPNENSKRTIYILFGIYGISLSHTLYLSGLKELTTIGMKIKFTQKNMCNLYCTINIIPYVADYGSVNIPAPDPCIK